jgi:putative PIN family toxin of toxin-antitoxin system
MCVQPYSDFFGLWQAFRDKKFVLCYTTEILYEYYEILSRYYSRVFADAIIEDILYAKNTERISIYYNWHLITSDPDDNKFLDCAISANASYIVTNDHHFDILKTIKFPVVSIKTIDEFQEII